MIKLLISSLQGSAEAQVFDVVFVALSVIKKIFVGVASDGWEGFRVSHSQLEEVPRAVMVARVLGDRNDGRNCVDVASCKRREENVN